MNDPIVDALDASLTAKMEERAAATTAQTTLIDAAKREGRKLTDAESKDFELRTQTKATLDKEIEELRAKKEARLDEIARDAKAAEIRSDVNGSQSRAIGGAQVLSEARTYHPESRNSFFADVYSLQMRGDFSAQDRLRRNYDEAVKEKEFRAREGGTEKRAITTSGVASLVIPQYLTDLAALILRNGRPFANLANRQQIPTEGMSFIIPQGTTGATVAAQATQNSAMSNTNEVWADLTINVATIAGQQQVSRQILERGAAGIDQIIYTDLARAYAAELDRQALYGLGSSGEMLGALKTSGIFAATAFGAAPTAANFLSKLAGQISSIAGAGAGFQADVIVMHPRRWGWLTTLVDSNNRPIINLEAGSYNAYGLNKNPGGYSGVVEGDGFKVVGSIQGIPVVTDGNMPKTVGTNNEDLVFVGSSENLLLWEDGDGMPKELRFDQTLGNQLTTILAVYGYAAFSAGRYATAVGSIGGLDSTATYGLVAPTF